ncbi:MAG: AAA family ATPase [Candidatus Dependentiae bacterium]
MHAIKLRFLLYFSGFFSFFCIAQDDAYYQKWVEYSDSHITLDDLAGSLPSELQEIVEFLKDPITNPGKRGYIFYGPPGTGKSTFARALAGQVGGICLAIAGSDFEGPYIGTGPERLDRLFKRAYELAVFMPVIIFIDEIEAVGTRSSTEANGSQYEIRTLDKLIAQISSIPSEIPLIIIGATNHEQKLDPALIRAGRCKLVEVQLPDLASRRAIIDFYCTKLAFDLPKDKQLALAKKTHGFNHAALEDLLVTAAKLTSRHHKSFESIVQDSLKTHRKVQKITNEKDEREKRREALEKINLSNARLGWWASVIGITATVTSLAYHVYKELPQTTKDKLKSYIFRIN